MEEPEPATPPAGPDAPQQLDAEDPQSLDDLPQDQPVPAEQTGIEKKSADSPAEGAPVEGEPTVPIAEGENPVPRGDALVDLPLSDDE